MCLNQISVVPSYNTISLYVDSPDGLFDRVLSFARD